MQSTHSKSLILKLAVLTLAFSAFAATAQQTLIPVNATWRYNASSNDLGTAWRNNFNDSRPGWTTGQQLFGTDVDILPLPFTTTLPFPHPVTMYFQYRFTYSGNPTGVTMVASNLVEDGAVYYLNGARVGDIRLANPNPTFATTATGSPEPQPGWEVFSFIPTNLIAGQNLMAVELHQSGVGSSDSAFAMTLTATPASSIMITNQPDSQTVPRGSTVMFTVGVSGSNPVYQWRKDGANIPGATSATYTIQNAQTTHAGTYSVVVSNTFGAVTSSNAVLTVVSDTFGPKIQEAVANLPDTNVINLSFDEAPSPTTARDTNNYRVTDVGGTKSIAVIMAQSSVRQVRLTLAEDLVPGTNYVLTVSNVEDSQGNPIDPDSQIQIAIFTKLFGFDQIWAFFYDFDPTMPTDLGTAWRAKDYDDSDENVWIRGQAGFYFYTAAPTLCGGVMPQSPVSYADTFITYYFRTHFNVPTNTGTGVFRFNPFIDDGAVFYLNGEEVGRYNMPAGPIIRTTRASSDTPPNCVPEPDRTATNIMSGDNVLAVEVHQAANPGLDVFMALALDGAISARLPPQVEVRITSPLRNSTNNSPVTITADASYAGGTVTNVQFFSGTTLLGNDSTAPYSFTWTDPLPSNNILRAVARANTGLGRTSAPVAITIGAAQIPPTVAITSPTNGSVVVSTQSLTVTATASDADGSVSQVEFTANGASIGVDTTAPYSAIWNAPTIGSVVLRAVARDNTGLMTMSEPVNITVRGPLRIARVANTNRVQVSWEGSSTLQCATNLIGTNLSNAVWTDVTNGSPYFTPSDGASRFYRLKN